MRRLWIKPVLLLLAALAAVTTSAQTIFVSPDVPADPIGAFVLQSEAVSHPGYVPALGIPTSPQLDALHKMDRPGSWLFSVETPTDLAGLLPTEALPQDVIRVDTGLGLYSFFFCGGAVLGGAVPNSSNLDAAYLDGGDSGDLIVSFDVPTAIGPITYDPADLVRYTRVGPLCTDWAFAGMELDASTAGAGILPSANVIGAARASGKYLLSLDVPSDLAPTAGPTTYLPGHVTSWDGFRYDLFDDLQSTGWSIRNLVDALSCQANPGRIDAAVNQILLTKAGGGNVQISWPPSCSSGGEDWGIYEGSIAAVQAGVYDHVRIGCTDPVPFLQETIAPAAASSYYLVVPHNNKDEGSFGLSVTPAIAERPQASLIADRCVATQALTPCP